jgi:hypothetical protein
MDKYVVICVDFRDYDFIKKIIADEGFPIEMEHQPHCIRLVTWIKDYDPSPFLQAYWGEEKFRPYVTNSTAYLEARGVDAAREYNEFLRIVVNSKPRRLATEIGHDYRLNLYSPSEKKEYYPTAYELFINGNIDNIPEMAAIKQVLNRNNSDLYQTREYKDCFCFVSKKDSGASRD